MALFLCLTAFMPALASAAGTWQATTNPMSVAHAGAGMAKLQDGRALMVSGVDGSTATATTEIYNPTTGNWTQTGSVNQPRSAFMNAVTLDSGKVLIAGGTDANATVDYGSAELYDPATGQWTYTGSLNTPRRYPIVAKLQDGRVLVAAGAHGAPNGSRFLNSAEIYNPATGQWTYTGNMNLAREGLTATAVLQDGRVMVLGGEGPWMTHSPLVEIYNPATGQWNVTSSLPHGTFAPTLTVLNDGRVLEAGGYNNGSAYNDANLYNPATGVWTAAAPMQHARINAHAVVLDDGRVLMTGGNDANGNAVLTSEIYDPATNTWTADASQPSAHAGGKILKLNDGSVLLAGGYGANGPTANAGIYLAASTTPKDKFVILGDSFSAGDGAGGYSDPTCRTNNLSLGAFLQLDHPDLNLAVPQNLACSGSTTSQVNGQAGFLYQNGQPDESVKLVTLTVGGNDVNFGPVVVRCFLESLNAEITFNRLPSLVRQTIAAAGCRAQNGQITQDLNALDEKLVSTYQLIHQAVPNAQIVVLGYPDLFPRNLSFFQSCNLLPAASINWMNQKQDALNAAIQNAATDPSVSDFVTYVSPNTGTTNVFAGGHICAAPENRLVNAIDGQTINELIANAQGPYSYSSLQAALQSIDSTPYHPNVVGYQAWASYVYSRLP